MSKSMFTASLTLTQAGSSSQGASVTPGEEVKPFTEHAGHDCAMVSWQAMASDASHTFMQKPELAFRLHASCTLQATKHQLGDSLPRM